MDMANGANSGIAFIGRRLATAVAIAGLAGEANASLRALSIRGELLQIPSNADGGLATNVTPDGRVTGSVFNYIEGAYGRVERPAIWPSAAALPIELDTGSIGQGRVTAATDAFAVGYVGLSAVPIEPIAGMWGGGAGDFIRIQSQQFIGGQALDAAGTAIVGYNRRAREDRAALWRVEDNGSTTYVRLDQDLEAFRTRALGTDGRRHVGFAVGLQVGDEYRYGPDALLWESDDEEPVVLTPPETHGTIAWDVAEEVQVGAYYDANDRIRAAAWRGSADTFRDLTPHWATHAEIVATVGSAHVGWAGRSQFGWDLDARPIVWLDDGAGFEAIVLPPPETLGWVSLALGPDSPRMGITMIGDRLLITSSGEVFDEITGEAQQRPILWTVVVPEPAGAAAIVLSLLVLTRRCART